MGFILIKRSHLGGYFLTMKLILFKALVNNMHVDRICSSI